MKGSAALLYDFPEAIWILFGSVGIIILFWILSQYRKGMTEKMGKMALKRSRTNFWAATLFYTLSWIFLGIALMEPKGNGRYPEEYQRALSGGETRRQAHEVALFIDASASMQTKDTRLGQSRLEEAKEIGDQIAGRLSGETISLYAFTSDVTKLVPGTLDYFFLRLALKNMKTNEGDIAGTNLLKVMEDIQETYGNRTTEIPVSIIFISDGGDTSLELLQGQTKRTEMEAILAAIRGLHGVTIYTVGVGSSPGGAVPGVLYQGEPVVSKIQEEILQALGKQGNGSYFYAEQYTAPDLAAQLVGLINQQVKVFQKAGEEDKGEAPDLVYDEYFQYPLAIAVLFLLAAMALPPCGIYENREGS